jgi:hypothetical protein
MSFDVSLLPWRFEGTTRRLSPFTAELTEFPKPAPHTQEQHARIEAVLRAAGGEGLSSRRIALGDGGAAEFSCGDLADGCALEVRGQGITPQLAQLIFDLMMAGDWVLVTDAIALAPSVACLNAPESHGAASVPADASELRGHLASGFEVWRSYANSVT